ncbi:hypothetical protein ACRQ4B_16225 [Curtobacterium sp. SP.BCo]|uniref:hypothetical protein n=1 Tax=Curtobacterium sp. SP.BCo TaxID=3435229 RepID=UPI003F73E50A
MTTITIPELQLAPTSAHDAVSLRRRRSAQRDPLTEVIETRRQHALQVAAVSTGIASVTLAASAAVVLTLTV